MQLKGAMGMHAKPQAGIAYVTKSPPWAAKQRCGHGKLSARNLVGVRTGVSAGFSPAFIKSFNYFLTTHASSFCQLDSV
jgi:hypothetical protein